MAEIVLGRWSPGPGVRPEDVEIPGPGLYEADFSVPGWLVPELDVQRSFTFDLGGSKVEHIRTRVVGDVLTTRFRVLDNPNLATPIPQTSGLFLALTAANVIRGIGAVILGALAVKLLQAVVDGLREVRKLGETPAGVGLAALGIAGAIAWIASVRSGGS